MKDAVYNRIKAILIDKLSVKSSIIVIGASIISDLEIDSINYVELILAVESEFSIEITDDDEDTIVTVEDLVDLVMDKNNLHDDVVE